MTIYHTPHGVCSQKMKISAENGIITDVQVIGGCDGNIKGIINLVKGMRVEDAIEKLSGIRCGRKDTSCPDQLSIAMKKMLDSNEDSQ